jgi:hypothetical protein
MPPKYTKFVNIFFNIKYIALPPLRGPGIDYTINFKANAQLLNKPVYPYSNAELTAQRKYLNKYLKRG